jgi:hypothetical protein
VRTRTKSEIYLCDPHGASVVSGSVYFPKLRSAHIVADGPYIESGLKSSHVTADHPVKRSMCSRLSRVGQNDRGCLPLSGSSNPPSGYQYPSSRFPQISTASRRSLGGAQRVYSNIL